MHDITDYNKEKYTENYIREIIKGLKQTGENHKSIPESYWKEYNIPKRIDLLNTHLTLFTKLKEQLLYSNNKPTLIIDQINLLPFKSKF